MTDMTVERGGAVLLVWEEDKLGCESDAPELVGVASDELTALAMIEGAANKAVPKDATDFALELRLTKHGDAVLATWICNGYHRQATFTVSQEWVR